MIQIQSHITYLPLDYYPFGMRMWDRSSNSSEYRYGFNGYELDNEVKGSGNSYDFGARIYDPRVAKFLSVDPRSVEYSWQTTYAYHRNSPIFWVDYLGGGDGPSGGTVFYLQYEGRASCIITGSTAIGLMVDTHGNVAVYNASSLGAGPIVGASTGWSAGFMTSDEVSETSGWGITTGILVTASAGLGFAGGVEFNTAWETDEEGLKDIDLGTTIALPIQIGAAGAQGGGYLEGTYTTILAEGNLLETLEKAFILIQEEFDIEFSQEEKDEYMNFILKSTITTPIPKEEETSDETSNEG